MIYDIESMARPRRVAKSLRKALGRLGHDRPLAACQEAVARMYGHADWQALGKAAGRAQSAEDAAAGAEVAAARRVAQGRALAGLGIPETDVQAVLDEVRPTGRGGDAPQAVPPAPVPRLTVRAVLRRAGEPDLDLGTHDVTEPVVEELERMGLDYFEAWAARGIPAYRLMGGLSEEARPHIGRKGFELPDFGDAWTRFKAAIGDAADRRVVASLKRHLDATRSARRALERAEATLRDASSATLADASGIEFFLPVNGFGRDDHFQSEPREVYEGSLRERYAETVEPRPKQGYGTPEWTAWDARCSAWERGRVPPFVWGTKPLHWSGIDAGWIRECVVPGSETDSGKPELETALTDMIESQLMDQHHEEAMDHIVDWEGLSFVDEWLPHAGIGDAVDSAFEARVAEWNAKQRLVSYYEDHTTMVPSRKGVDVAGILRWCEADVEARRAELERLGSWTAPTFPPGSPPYDPFEGYPHPHWRAEGM